MGLFPALEGVGGIQEASRLTAAALAEIAPRYGWSVDFLSLNDPPEHRTFTLDGMQIAFRAFGRAKARFMISVIGHTLSDSHIVLAAHPYLSVAAAQMKLLQPKIRMIVVSHGIEVWQPLSVLRRKAFLSADVFVAPSRYTINQLVETHDVPEIKTRRLPWPLSPDFRELVERCEKLPLPARFPTGLVVLATARLATGEKYKGVDQLILAIARLAPKLPSLRLAVIATGDDVARHEQIARELGVSQRVTFFSGLSSAEIAACYSRSDVFALPSTGEGFGFVFLEAMAFRKPVIGAAAGGVTDIVEHEKNGLLVEPGDVEALTRALERLLSDESLRLELGREGAESVRLEFQFAAFRSRLEAILRECSLASEEDE